MIFGFKRPAKVFDALQLDVHDFCRVLEFPRFSPYETSRKKPKISKIIRIQVVVIFFCFYRVTELIIAKTRETLQYIKEKQGQKFAIKIRKNNRVARKIGPNSCYKFIHLRANFFLLIPINKYFFSIPCMIFFEDHLFYMNPYSQKSFLKASIFCLVYIFQLQDNEQFFNRSSKYRHFFIPEVMTPSRYTMSFINDESG